jgi:hypothetical protein
MINRKRAVSALTVTAVLAIGLWPFLGSGAESKQESVVTADGALHVPDHYRTQYETLGSWSIAGGSSGGAKEMHVVYASPHAIEDYRAKGKFADGAVLVKEVWDAETGSMSTGTVSHVSKLKGWFVLVKASNGLGSMPISRRRRRARTTRRIARDATYLPRILTGYTCKAIRRLRATKHYVGFSTARARGNVAPVAAGRIQPALCSRGAKYSMNTFAVRLTVRPAGKRANKGLDPADQCGRTSISSWDASSR